MSAKLIAVSIQFYAGLNDFLCRDRRGHVFDVYLNNPTTVKDLIESLGVPHTEIGLILVNHESVDFSCMLSSGDSVQVYPYTEKVNVSISTPLRLVPWHHIKFVLDTHLGKLAKYLRMLGFDTLYQNDYQDDRLAEISSKEHRILLSRDRGLLKRKIIDYGHYVRETDPLKQLNEIAQWLDIRQDMQPFTRCSSCNGLLYSVDKKDIEHQLEEKTKQYYNDFKQCTECKKIYWKGTHYLRLNNIIQAITDDKKIISK